MKRVLCVIVLMTVIFSFCCVAESIDLSSVGDADLPILYDLIREEMKSRGILRSGVLLEGAYTVGTDVAPGIYNITCDADDEKKYVQYSILSKEAYDNYLKLSSEIGVILDYSTINVGKIDRLELKDGSILIIKKNPMILEEESASLLAP